MMPKLTDKQKRFCDEYLIDLNATQAAIRSGYSKKTAQQMGSENLLKPVIQAYIEQKQKKIAEKNNISVEWVITRLVENCDRSMQAVAVLDHEGNETGEYRYEANAANRSLELIGKHLGMFGDKLQLNGDINVNVNEIKSKLHEKLTKYAVREKDSESHS